MNNLLVLLLLSSLLLHFTMAAMPGTFFWKPRLGIDLSIPTTESASTVQKPNIENIRAGLVVMVEGYKAGMSFLALAAGLTIGQTYMKTLDPSSAFFYTNTYRWALRYLSLVPYWLSGQGIHFCETHKVWLRRFYYMDEFVPNWLRKLFPYVSQESWDTELKDFKMYKKYAEAAFGKHYRYPKKVFDDFRSQFTEETAELGQVSHSELNEN